MGERPHERSGAVAESIRAAVTDAERGAQVSVDAVTVGMGGMDVRGAQSRGLYDSDVPTNSTPAISNTLSNSPLTFVWNATARCSTCSRRISPWMAAPVSAAPQERVLAS